MIGLGAMGAKVATRLVWEGFNPTVYDISDVSVRLFTNDVGGMMSGSPKMLGQSSDFVITVLPDAEALKEALFGWQGLATGLRRGGVLIDMSSVEPRTAIELAARLAQHGIDMIDAPALGTPAEARAGQLSLILGGDPVVVERCQPILSRLASRIQHAGPAGSGQAGAALGDFLRGAGLLALSEALRIGKGFGLDPEALASIAGQFGGGSPWLIAQLRDQMLTRRFDSGLALGHVLKGMEVTEDVAKAANIQAPLLAACRAAWAGARDAIGSGADQTELPRWLEGLRRAETQREKTQQEKMGETIADGQGATTLRS